MTLRKVQCMNYVRSGHHLLVRCLKSYFPDFRYCNKYHYCKTSPCPDPRTTFQKNHDYKIEILPDWLYLVQYRYPVSSLISHFKYRVEQHQNIEDTLEAWEDYAQQGMKMWADFARKWVNAQESPMILRLPYEQLVEEPMTALKTVYSYFTPEEELDEQRISEIICEQDISMKNTPEKFKYFNHDFCGRIERIGADQIQQAGYELQYQ